MVEKKGIDWSSLWKKEDWWACWLGWTILLVGILGLLPLIPKIGKWKTLAKIFPAGLETIPTALLFFAFLFVLTVIGLYFIRRDTKIFYSYIPGFIVIFALAFLAMVIAGGRFLPYWEEIPYVIWAIAFGLFISNVLRVPGWLRPAVATEYFIKIGLVCMGATILFTVIIKAGVVGMGQAVLVVTGVWLFAYWLGRRLGLDERFSGVIATGVSICGVSASIAAGGALRGDPKHITYVIAWIMVCAVVMIIVMPPIAIALKLPTNMAGAWIGGVIDNTGSVVAAGEVIGTKAALETAALVKMAQNILIGFAAFILAVWATLSLDRARGAPRPSFIEIWYRFPKFIVGFMVASLIATFLLEPFMPAKELKALTKLVGAYQTWFFALCFVCIGLETRFKELVAVGGGRPAIVYWVAQLWNAIWTLGIVYLLWSGWFFTPPILPD